MGDVREVFEKYETYIVRQWDGMDGCWTDCTGDVGREEALRAWASRHNVSYDEIDYYRIFPDGTRMDWDGSEGREMHLEVRAVLRNEGTEPAKPRAALVVQEEIT
jgi:hypothetical protein